ncbi:hypothetical protein B0H19DRAFT_1066870 [Mycena capillaripes]|nr:hypothetical protein B0H19DRAFT_1066870 [Mycena capillaripes]
MNLAQTAVQVASSVVSAVDSLEQELQRVREDIGQLRKNLDLCGVEIRAGEASLAAEKKRRLRAEDMLEQEQQRFEELEKGVEKQVEDKVRAELQRDREAVAAELNRIGHAIQAPQDQAHTYQNAMTRPRSSQAEDNAADEPPSKRTRTRQHHVSQVALFSVHTPQQRKFQSASYSCWQTDTAATQSDSLPQELQNSSVSRNGFSPIPMAEDDDSLFGSVPPSVQGSRLSSPDEPGDGKCNDAVPGPNASRPVVGPTRQNQKDVLQDLGRLVLLQGQQRVEPGTLVWAKAVAFPWWPATVFHDDDPSIPAKVLAQSHAQREKLKEKDKDFLHVVRFYDKTKSWQHLSLDKMRELGESKELDQAMLSKKSKIQPRWKGNQWAECRTAYHEAMKEMESGDNMPKFMKG